MIFKQSSNGSCKIGRKVEFSNPLRYSNKKHFWAGGVGNYGLLTTEQIQILNQMKQRQKRANLYDTKCIQKSLNHSLKELRYQDTDKLKVQNKYCHDFFQFNDQAQNKEELRNALLVHNQGMKKRSVSQIRSYNEVEQPCRKFTTISHEQKQYDQSNSRANSGFRKLGNSKRAKTMGVEQIQQVKNPQEINKIDLMFSGLINRQKSDKQNLRIESGNIRFNHSPQNLQNISISIEKRKPLQSNIYSERSRQQNQADNVPNKNIQETKGEIQGVHERIFKNVKRIDQKRLTKQKFRRDHSPTYCNSIEYPLKYYRHV